MDKVDLIFLLLGGILLAVGSARRSFRFMRQYLEMPDTIRVMETHGLLSGHWRFMLVQGALVNLAATLGLALILIACFASWSFPAVLYWIIVVVGGMIAVATFVCGAASSTWLYNINALVHIDKLQFRFPKSVPHLKQIADVFAGAVFAEFTSGSATSTCVDVRWTNIPIDKLERVERLLESGTEFSVTCHEGGNELHISREVVHVEVYDAWGGQQLHERELRKTESWSGHFEVADAVSTKFAASADPK